MTDERSVRSPVGWRIVRCGRIRKTDKVYAPSLKVWVHPVTPCGCGGRRSHCGEERIMEYCNFVVIKCPECGLPDQRCPWSRQEVQNAGDGKN